MSHPCSQPRLFESSLVESTSMLRTRRRWPVIVSISAQAAVLAAVIVVPLLHPEILQTHALKLTTLAPPPTPKPPVPPPQPVRIVPTLAMETSAPSLPHQATVALSALWHARGIQTADPAIANIAIGVGSMGDPGLPPGIGSGTGSGTSPDISVAPAPHIGPTRVSSGVSAGLLLAPIQPVYPPIAKVSHTEGTVVIHAIISRSGRIERAEVVSGSQMLAGAALEAVRNARYRPYLLNGDPTEVDTTISINFHLSS